MTVPEVVVCTAIDSSHVPEALTLARSVRRHGQAPVVTAVVDRRPKLDGFRMPSRCSRSRISGIAMVTPLRRTVLGARGG